MKIKHIWVATGHVNFHRVGGGWLVWSHHPVNQYHVILAGSLGILGVSGASKVRPSASTVRCSSECFGKTKDVCLPIKSCSQTPSKKNVVTHWPILFRQFFLMKFRSPPKSKKSCIFSSTGFRSPFLFFKKNMTSLGPIFMAKWNLSPPNWSSIPRHHWSPWASQAMLPWLVPTSAPLRGRWPSYGKAGKTWKKNAYPLVN